MTNPQPRIAIVGAGPAGLTLACLLHRQHIPFTLFDLRPRPTQQSFDEPAGSLDLHHDTGLAALQELDLLDAFHGLTADCTEETIVADLNGAVLFRDDGVPDPNRPSRPEISRNKLTQLLLSGLPEESIRWQHKLVATAISDETNTAELDFGDNGKHSFDLVVGADGAWSRVRSLITDAKPQYTGMQNVTINIREITRKRPDLAQMVGSGTFFSLADRCGIVSQRAAGDTARMYAFVNTSDEHYATTQDLKTKTASQAKEVLLEGPFRRYGPVVKDLIASGCDDETATNPGAFVDIRPMYTLCSDPETIKTEGQHKRGVTLIGDAAHVMPPNGEGVNSAMKDALVLSRAIAGAVAAKGEEGSVSPLHERLDQAVREAEKDVADRAREVAAETVQLLDMMYGGDNGSETMAGFFKGMHEGSP